MRIQRRSLLAGAALCGLVLPVRSMAEADYLADLYAKAKQEGELTWYIVYWPSDRADKHAALFTKAYPGVRVNVVRATAQVAYQRLSQDIQAKAANCDVFTSTDMGQFVTLKTKGRLLPYKVQSAAMIDPRFQSVDPDDTYHIVNVTTVSLGYNPNKAKADEIPTDWKGFVDPKWKGRLVVGHPGFSGFVGTWVVQMNELYGWDYFEQLAELKPYVGRSIIDTVTVLVSGERALGASPSSLVLREASRGNPVAPAYPSEGSVQMISAAAIPTDTRHPNAAKLFMEFLYSHTTAEENVEEFSLPLRRDVELPPAIKRLQDSKTIRPTIDEIVKGIPELTEKWRDTFGV